MMKSLDSIYYIGNGRTKRISSYDRSGLNKDSVAIRAGEVNIFVSPVGYDV
ncbi:hypothetical protein [Paenibacillus montanisoli]|uniref:hypothetical protein n=1 Tax=Paenibacillus montanisoli TaxID=2081970 RepID=UPI00140410E9|nr:hypothetical protein [Paenibacillus montanisoli]